MKRTFQELRSQILTITFFTVGKAWLIVGGNKEILPRRHRRRITAWTKSFFRKKSDEGGYYFPISEEVLSQVRKTTRKIASLAYQICQLCREENKKALELSIRWEQEINSLSQLLYI